MMNGEMTHRLLALNKPKGYVVTRSDELGRKTVYELLPEWAAMDDWVPIGRLDMDSKGLLLFTREGGIVDRLTKPGNCVKVYELWIRGHVSDDHIQTALAGVETPEGVLKALRIERKGGAGPKTRLLVELDEGKNRHLRRLFGGMTDAQHGTALKVLELKRLQVGCVTLDIPSGTWRFLTDGEESILLR